MGHFVELGKCMIYPIIMKEIDTNLILRYNDFEEYQPGKWKTKKDNKKVKLWQFQE